MTKQKILLVCKQDISLSGGVESTMRLFSRELTEEGYEVAVLYFDRKIKYFNSFIKNGIQFFVAPVKPSKIPIILFRNYKKASQEAISIIFQSFVPDKIWSRYAIATWGIISSSEFERLNIELIHIFPTSAGLQNKVNLKSISVLPLWKRPKNYLLGLLYYFENSKADTAILNSSMVKPIVFSQNMLYSLSREFNFPKKKLYLIQPGIDTTMFNGSANQEELEMMRKALPYVPTQYALFVGRIEDNKNIELMIKCIYSLENINLVIVGDGSSMSKIKNVVKQLNLTGRVFFTGKQSIYLKALYSDADFLILPSIVESFGMVILEALACGTPVIAFGGNKVSTAADEIIQKESHGIVVSDVSVPALTAAIEKMSKYSAEIRKRFSEENVSYIAQNWNHKNMIHQLLNINNIK